MRHLKLSSFLVIFLLLQLFTNAQVGTNNSYFNPLDTAIFEGEGLSAYTVAIVSLPNEKTLVAGQSTLYNGKPVPALIRLNADGKLDTGFYASSFGSYLSPSWISAIALQTDGKIIVATDTASGYSDIHRIFRLNADGSFDNSFQQVAANGYIKAIGILSNGKVLIGGEFTNVGGINKKYLACLTTTGSLDQTFNSGGVGPDSVVNTILCNQQLGVYIGGVFTHYNNASANYIASIYESGARRSAFQGSFDSRVNCLISYKDSFVLVGGAFTKYNNTNINGGLIKVNQYGNLDNGFSAANDGGECFSLSVQNGKIIKTGLIYNQVTHVRQSPVMRLFADGSIDSTFSTVNSGIDDMPILCTSVASDGKIIVGNGYFNTSFTRLLENGEEDLGFNPGMGVKKGTVSSLKVLPDNKILVCGSFKKYNNEIVNGIVRLYPNGMRDTTFNKNGKGFYSTSNIFPFGLTKMLIQPDGKILISGDFFYNNKPCSNIVRINPDGSVDETFNPNGSGFNDLVRDIALQPDGKIVVGGNFNKYNGTPCYKLIRLNADGSKDTQFNNILFSGIYSVVYSIALQQDGKILLGGRIDNNCLIRLNSSGSIDSSFSCTVNNDVTFVSSLPDGKILISGGNGGLYGVNGNIGYGFFKLNTNGSTDTSFKAAQIPGSFYQVKDILLLESGKMYIAGLLRNNSGQSAGLIRLLADGREDSSFATIPTTSIYDTLMYTHTGQVKSMAFQGDDNLILGGFFNSCNGVVRSNLASIKICPRLSSTQVLNINASQLPYTWNGQIYTSAGDYSLVTTASGGCDSVANLHLNVSGSYHDIYLACCSNQLPYNWNGISCNSTGTYWGYFTGSNGEDSVVIMHLTVGATSSTSLNVSVCTNQLPYLFNGTQLNQAGDYKDTLVNQKGCDSIVSLHLIINTLPIVSAGTYDSLRIYDNPIVLTGTPSGGTFSGTGVSGNLFYPNTAGIGNHTITYSYQDIATGCSKSSSTVIKVNEQCLFTVASSITGPTNVCAAVLQKDSAIFSISAIDAESYLWTVSNSATMKISPIINQNIVKVFFNTTFTTGTINLIVVGKCGGSITRTFAVTKSIPGAPVAITGPNGNAPLTSVCAVIEGSSVTYVAQPPLGSGFTVTAYRWTVPIGATIESSNTPDSSSINVRYTSTPTTIYIKVKAITNCGITSDRSLTLSTAVPIAPSTVNGPINACPYIVNTNGDTTGKTVVYWISRVKGAATYLWTLPTGVSLIDHPGGLGTINDTIIKVIFTNNFISGTVSVQSISPCGNSAARSISVKLIPPTAPSVAITYSTLDPCSLMGTNSVATYSISSMPANATSMYWTVPSGATIVNGQGTTLINVRFDNTFTGGLITVYSVNNCLMSSGKSLNLTLKTLGTPLGFMITSQTGCPNRVINYQINPVQYATSYMWTAPAGATIIGSSTGLTVSVQYPSTAIADTIRVRARNNCSMGPERKVKVALAACALPIVQVSYSKDNNDRAQNDDFFVEAFPNPTRSLFTLSIKSDNDNAPIQIMVTDFSGRLIEVINKASRKDVLRIGTNYTKGIYFIKVMHTNRSKVIKLIKT